VAEFSRSEYEFYVVEEQSELIVGQVLAVDRDLPPYDDVIYTLLFPPASVRYNHWFRISADNGTIVTTRPLDREVVDNFRFAVRACSPADACSTAHVTVHVTDVNDHAPVFLLPATPNDSVSVTNTFRRDNVIMTLVATDADVGDNGRVGYQLANVDHVVDFYFQLDKVSGDVIARRDSVPIGSYTLVVVAMDAGTPPQRVHSAITLIVNVSTSGETAPQQPWTAGANGLTVVIVIVGTSLPVAILLLAAILVLLRNRRRGNRNPTAVTSRDAYYDSKSLPTVGAAASQGYATLSPRTTTKLASAAIVTNNFNQPRSTLTSSTTPNNANSSQVHKIFIFIMPAAQPSRAACRHRLAQRPTG